MYIIHYNLFYYCFIIIRFIIIFSIFLKIFSFNLFDYFKEKSSKIAFMIKNYFII